jgi:AcrR family transcriptional regulator
VARTTEPSVEPAPDDEGWVAVEGASEPDETLEVRDLDAMLDVTHPTRGMMLRHLRHPRTVADVAAEMGVPVTRLYHHINRLHDHGIIRVVATRQVAAVTERRYQVAARSFRPHRDLLEHSDPADLARVLGSVFDTAKLGFIRLVEERGPLSLRDEDDSMALSLAELRMPPDRRRELVKRLEALFEEFHSHQNDDDADETVTLLIAAFPDPSHEQPD